MAFVHQGSNSSAERFLAAYGLQDIQLISDPELRLYKTFGLERISRWRMVHPQLLWRGFVTAILRKQGFGKLEGDEFQMPGVFLIHKGAVVRSHKYREVWDHPDFKSFALPAMEP